MIPNNASVALILLALTLNFLSFLLWQLWHLRRQIRDARKEIDKEAFSVESAIIERERSRISAELHDELGTLLSIIYMDLEVLGQEAGSLSPSGENRLIGIRRNLNMVIESIRNNVWNISGQMFDQVDLAFAIRELCHKLDRYRGTQVTFVQSGRPFALDEKYKLNLFRITQELLTNVVKHSSAWSISVHIDWEDDSGLSIAIEDDGEKYAERKNRQGMGMANIAKRAAFIGAIIKQDRLKKGHRVVLSVKIT
ncbi:MAG TPA: histidine kinase [Chryseosolibacter sp.]